MPESTTVPAFSERDADRIRWRPAPAVRAAASALAIVAAIAPAADAQSTPDARLGWELVVPSGMLIPTGDQQGAIRRGGLTAVQLTRVVRPALAFGASLGWARSRDVASVGDPKLDIFTFDVGGELRGSRWFADHRVTLRPFAGIGAGVRRYDHRSLDVDATHNATAYASAGGELGLGRVRLRLEARDYVTSFEPLGGEGPSRMRNEVAVTAGLRLVRR